MTVRLFSAIALLTAVILLCAVGCNPGYRQSITRDCPLPPPPPACAALEFSNVVYDTSSTAPLWRWKISRVLGAESVANEFGLVQFQNELLLLKGSKQSNAAYFPVRLTDITVLENGFAPGASAKGVLTRVGGESIMGDADLYYASATSSGVVVGEPLPNALNTEVQWDGHATISKDGRFMVFASEREGSLGGTDLYFSVNQGGHWSTPKRLPNSVNTPCDEISPQFAREDSVLLFSSAGHATAGGYDIFESSIRMTEDELIASEPRNMGLPVNTPYDEMFPLMPNNFTLYYASNQPKASGTKLNDFDVFVLHGRSLKKPSTYRKDSPTDAPITTLSPTSTAVTVAPTVAVAVPATPQVKEKGTVTGRVVHQQTQQPVVDAEVTAKDDKTKEVISKTTTDTAGSYYLDVPVETRVEITAQSPDLFYDNVVVTLPAEKKNTIVVLEKPLALPLTYFLRINFPTSVFDAPYDNTLDSLGADTEQTWKQALDQLVENVKLSGNRLKKLVLIGHTDDVSTDASNMKLGKQRVDFVMAELVKRGINMDQLEGRSAGERLLPDKHVGESIDMWRKRARRVELVKVMQ